MDYRKHYRKHRHRKGIGKAVALAAAASLLQQNFAFALCADGTSFPAGGYGVGQPSVVSWTPGTLTATEGSIFIPDNSVFENNDPSRPLTGGGHNWVFDQGVTLCKMTNVGPGGGTPTSWAFPAGTPPTSCINLPVVNGAALGALTDIPAQGEAITPTCDPALLSTATAPNPANTYFNQLGCSISHGVATTAKTATTFLFLVGPKSGLFNVPLSNAANPTVGGEAGKVAATPGTANWYSDLPSGQKFSAASISPDGRFAMATSKNQNVYACLNPLGDPGDPGQPINPNFTVPPAGTVKCMIVGNNALKVDLTSAFGPDNQPYFGGQRVVNTFDSTPGGTQSSAWPQCIAQGTNFTIAQAFANHSAGHCGNAAPNAGFLAALVLQPLSLISHGSYMYSGLEGGPFVTQMKVTTDPVSGFSQYAFRTYLTGVGITSGLGVADDLGSLMVYVNPNIPIPGGGNPIPEVAWKLPLCEDF